MYVTPETIYKYMSVFLEIFLLLVIAVSLLGCESNAQANQTNVTKRVMLAHVETPEQHTKKIHVQQLDMMNRLKKIHTHLENKKEPVRIEPIIFWVQGADDKRIERIEGEVTELKQDIKEITKQNSEILRLIGRIEGTMKR